MRIFENLHGFLWQSMTTNNCNTYLLDGAKRVLIDPGHRALFDHVERGLAQLKLEPGDIDLVICTHAHPDHIEAVQLFKNSRPLLALHADEWQWVATVGRQMSAAFGIDVERLQPDFFIGEGKLSVGDIELEIFHSPGHSPGSICLYWPAIKALFSGDVVFKEGLGRTDLPGGDGAQLKKSIQRLAALEIEWLLPGHGEIVSGVQAVRNNFREIEQFWFDYI